MLQRNPELADPSLCVRDRDRSELTCVICKMLVVRPLVLNNGDGKVIDSELYPCGDGPFCGTCIRLHLLMTPACPVCNRPTTAGQLVEDTRMERAVRSAIVKCVYCEEGCQWVGEIRDFRAHRVSCAFLTAARDGQSLEPQSDSSNSSTRFDFESADCGSSMRSSRALSHRASARAKLGVLLSSASTEHSEPGGHISRVECTEASDNCFAISLTRSRYCRVLSPDRSSSRNTHP